VRARAVPPDEGLSAMMAGLRERMAGSPALAGAAELVSRAEALARLGKTAQAAELLRQAAAALPASD
jgi:hypothetical protein